ncbi:hypothetical protein T03_13096 [Trichinella britovi]|uniref:Uncharacterized protein n=1 Tax=Trichinella britovi TaxID=45882 RepID=A0A0V1AIL6_TRIBR|nr:hypothetical protein T03_13096 [Trichinella britovi]
MTAEYDGVPEPVNFQVPSFLHPYFVFSHSL